MQEWYLADRNYEYVTSGEGPIRKFLTLKSPFIMDFENNLSSGPGKITERYFCNLYRIISLYSGVHKLNDKDYFSDRYYINEEIYAEAYNHKTIYTGHKKNEENLFRFDETRFKLPLFFRPRFSTYIPGLLSINPNPEISYPNAIHPRGWFAIGNNTPPCPGFGFACNCHVEKVSTFYDQISWDVSPTWHLRCLHQFMDRTNTPGNQNDYDFGEVIGSNWFYEIYKPLWAV
jgi:hypothetical protein